MLVTPEMAAEWMKANRMNRAVRDTAKDKVKRALVSGRWKFNGQTVTFSKTWRLMDGQHRLLAIIETGIAAEILVWTGIDDDAMDTIDTGGAGSRKPHEAWAINNGVLVTRDTVSRVNASWAVFHSTGSTRTAEEFGAAMAMFREGADAIAPYFAAHDRRISRANIIAAFIVTWKLNPAGVEELAKTFVSGANMPSGSAILYLHRWVHKLPGGGGLVIRLEETCNAIGLIIDALEGVPRTKAAGLRSEDVAKLRKLYGIASA